jgi:hypothetical protein
MIRSSDSGGETMTESSEAANDLPAMEDADGLASTLASVRTETGLTLHSLVEASPVLLIFLRHFGCSFCRQAISDIAGLRGELAMRGVRPLFVHLGTPERAKPFFDYYGIGDVARVSDPTGALYRHPAFAVPRTSWLGQVVNPVVWWAWLSGGLRHGIGTIQEDGDQMPGLFFLKDAKIVRRYRYRTIADEPDYLRLVR